MKNIHGDLSSLDLGVRFILVISNYNSFRVTFDKIVSVYFLFQKYIFILALEMASPGNRHCANIVSAHFRSRWKEMKTSEDRTHATRQVINFRVSSPSV